MKCVILTFLILFLVLNVSTSSNLTTDVLPNEPLTEVEIEEIGRKLKNIWVQLKVKFSNEDTFVGRCLGAFNKLRLVLNLVIFKLGVIVTTLFFLSIMMFKSLGIGVLILIISSVGFFSKLSAAKQDYHGPSQAAVHLHLHNKGEHYKEVPQWYDRFDHVPTKDPLEKQAIAELYSRLGLSKFSEEHS